MFSFHKPKIYRSLSGCCICKAKSSSSRFTDSKKYESEFEKCFKILEKRSGEICNACVLLVKRWKKLPSNTTRDWHHVVDARAGPGTKSIKTKQNSIGDGLLGSAANSLNGSHHRKHRKSKIRANCIRRVGDQMASPEASDSSDMDEDIDDIDDLEEEIELQKNKKRIESRPFGGDDCNKSRLESITKRDEECESPTNTGIISFVDMTFWKKEKICCGVIFKGPDNEVLIYPKLLEPCYCRKNKTDRIVAPVTVTSMMVTGSDSSSVGSSSLAEDDGNSNASSGNTSLT